MDENQWTGEWGEVKDSSGMHHYGQAQGDARIDTNGKYGNAGYFDGVSDYIRASTYGYLSNPGNEVTVEARINLTTDHNQKIAGN